VKRRTPGRARRTDRACRALVLGVDVGVQETNGHGFHFFAGQAAAGFLEARVLKRSSTSPAGEHPLVDFPGQVARNERPVTVEEEL